MGMGGQNIVGSQQAIRQQNPQVAGQIRQRQLADQQRYSQSPQPYAPVGSQPQPNQPPQTAGMGQAAGGKGGGQMQVPLQMQGQLQQMLSGQQNPMVQHQQSQNPRMYPQLQNMQMQSNRIQQQYMNSPAGQQQMEQLTALQNQIRGNPNDQDLLGRYRALEQGMQQNMFSTPQADALRAQEAAYNQQLQQRQTTRTLGLAGLLGGRFR
jgi:hypothetical protein